MGKTVALDLIPGVTAVARHIEAARGATAGHCPGADLPVPDAGEETVRILRVHREPRAAGIAIDEQDVFPRLAAVLGTPHATRFFGLGARSQRADENVLRIVGIDDD